MQISSLALLSSLLLCTSASPTPGYAVGNGLVKRASSVMTYNFDTPFNGSSYLNFQNFTIVTPSNSSNSTGYQNVIPASAPNVAYYNPIASQAAANITRAANQTATFSLLSLAIASSGQVAVVQAYKPGNLSFADQRQFTLGGSGNRMQTLNLTSYGTFTGLSSVVVSVGGGEEGAEPFVIDNFVISTQNETTTAKIDRRAK